MKTIMKKVSRQSISGSSEHCSKITPLPVLRPPACQCSLSNTDGFWELTFNGRYAILKQHPALFFVASLLADLPPQPITAVELAARTYSMFESHPDLIFSLPWLCQHRAEADIA